MPKEIAAKPEQTAMSKRLDPQLRSSLAKLLTGLAEARQGAVSKETLVLYSAHLSEFDPADVQRVARNLARRKREEGETAFPSLGELLQPLELARKLKAQEDRAASERQEQIRVFWDEVMPYQIEEFGFTEEQVLMRFPSMRGTKPEVAQ